MIVGDESIEIKQVLHRIGVNSSHEESEMFSLKSRLREREKFFEIQLKKT